MTVLNKIPVYKLLDAFMILGTLGLGICYAIARHLNHVNTFCDISDLVVNLPERIIFRMNFSLVGGLLAFLSLPTYHMISSRVGKKTSVKLGSSFQASSGIGVILVGACGPSEIIQVHLLAAFLGFGCSFAAQLIYNFALYPDDARIAPDHARTIFKVRCVLSALFLACAVALGLCEAGVLPEYPWGHVMEWSLWFNLLTWYFTLRWDLKDFYVGSMDDESKDVAVHMGVPLLL